MKTLALIVLVFASGIYGQTEAKDVIEATTADGKAVLLRPDGTWEFKAVPKVKPKGVSAAGFAAIDEQMTYSQVVEILGREGELLSESNIGDLKTVMYSWKADKGKGSLGASMNAMFQGGKLLSKSQFGLK